jgi:hypothetical protein
MAPSACASTAALVTNSHVCPLTSNHRCNMKTLDGHEPPINSVVFWWPSPRRPMRVIDRAHAVPVDQDGGGAVTIDECCIGETAACSEHKRRTGRYALTANEMSLARRRWIDELAKAGRP